MKAIIAIVLAAALAACTQTSASTACRAKACIDLLKSSNGESQGTPSDSQGEAASPR